MVDDGVTHCILEATSMGLAEHRVDTAFFDVAVISNITHEHLDYHGDYATYLTAKGACLTWQRAPVSSIAMTRLIVALWLATCRNW